MTESSQNNSSDEFPQITTLGFEEMPKVRHRSRSKSTLMLIEKIMDGKLHAIPDVTTKEEKEVMVRKLRYAALLADREVSTNFFPEGPPGKDGPPGVYFKGYPRGEAPKRGRRK